jgi:hypothetical protein
MVGALVGGRWVRTEELKRREGSFKYAHLRGGTWLLPIRNF